MTTLPPSTKDHRLAVGYLLAVALPLGVGSVLLVPALRGHATTGGATATGPADVGTSLLILAAVVLLAARLFGALAVRIGQPQVMGEIVAGLVLGPSALGALAPGVEAWLVPDSLRSTVTGLANLGLVLFIFGVGRHARQHATRGEGRLAVALAHASISVAAVGGVAIAIPLYRNWAGRGTSLIAFALFMACALAITALPVLARILRDRGIASTRIGVQSILAAAVADVTAWCLLAVAVAFAHGASPARAAVTVALTAAYTLILAGPGKALLRAVFARLEGREHGEELAAAVLVIGLLLSAWVTSAIGVHAIFGAFLYGMVVPDGPRPLRRVAARLDQVTSVVLMPFFFLGTGLRTDLWHAGRAGSLLAVLGVVVLVATVGKAVGPILVARIAGAGTRDALRLGALLNTRGLTELIVLNIGLSMGILSPRLFVVLVGMAVVTTAVTGPALTLLGTSLPDADQLDRPAAQDEQGRDGGGDQREDYATAGDGAGQHAR